MKPPPLHGINGRLRRHITSVGAHHANRISSPNKAVSNDDYLRGLMDGGSLTEEQIHEAIKGYNQTPSSFAWLQKIKDSVLDKADNVFLAKYERDPTKDADFRSNGDYHKICKNLKRDQHYYDSDLEKLRWDHQGNVVRSSRTAGTAILVDYESTVRKVLFILFHVAVLGFIFSGESLELSRWVSVDVMIGLVALCIVVSLFTFHYNCTTRHRCSNCGKRYRIRVFGTWSTCKRCGARFQ